MFLLVKNRGVLEHSLNSQEGSNSGLRPPCCQAVVQVGYGSTPMCKGLTARPLSLKEYGGRAPGSININSPFKTAEGQREVCERQIHKTPYTKVEF